MSSISAEPVAVSLKDAPVADPQLRRHRRFGDAVLHAPQTLRALVRADEIWLVVLAAVVGFYPESSST